MIFYLPGPGTHLKAHHDTYGPEWGREAKEAEARTQGIPPSQVDEVRHLHSISRAHSSECTHTRKLITFR